MEGLASFLASNSPLICERYSGDVSKASSKAALAALLDINVCEWLCKMEPRHKSSEWLKRYFGCFVNGHYVNQCDGYTCEVYVGYEGEIELKADVTALVGCGTVRVRVPDWSVKRVIVSGGTLDVNLGDHSHIHVDYVEGTNVIGDQYNSTIKMITAYA